MVFIASGVNPEWKEVRLPIEDDLESLKMRVHLNIMRRGVSRSEREEWVREARRLLQQRGLKGTQEEIADALGMTREWVKKWDPVVHQTHKSGTAYHFFGYNVWGFKDESWRKLIIPGDPNQPDKEGYPVTLRPSCFTRFSATWTSFQDQGDRL